MKLLFLLNIRLISASDFSISETLTHLKSCAAIFRTSASFEVPPQCYRRGKISLYPQLRRSGRSFDWAKQKESFFCPAQPCQRQSLYVHSKVSVLLSESVSLVKVQNFQHLNKMLPKDYKIMSTKEFIDIGECVGNCGSNLNRK